MACRRRRSHRALGCRDGARPRLAGLAEGKLAAARSALGIVLAGRAAERRRAEAAADSAGAAIARGDERGVRRGAGDHLDDDPARCCRRGDLRDRAAATSRRLGSGCSFGSSGHRPDSPARLPMRRWRSTLSAPAGGRPGWRRRPSGPISSTPTTAAFVPRSPVSARRGSSGFDVRAAETASAEPRLLEDPARVLRREPRRGFGPACRRRLRGARRPHPRRPPGRRAAAA